MKMNEGREALFPNKRREMRTFYSPDPRHVDGLTIPVQDCTCAREFLISKRMMQLKEDPESQNKSEFFDTQQRAAELMSPQSLSDTFNL